MSDEFKLASNSAPFSRLCDRFVTTGYSDDYSLDQKLGMVAAIDGIHGVGLGWPCGFRNGTEVKKLLDRHGLACCTLDTDVYTDRMFRNGSLSNRDPKIRRTAIDRAKSAMDAAVEAGAPDINFWMGHDGFEYFFQGHYADVWKWIVEGLQEIAEHNPQMPVSIEPKCKEPRGYSYLANTGKALFLVNKISKPNLGITLDFGHSIAALENAAECATLCLLERRLQQIHVNDNYRDWDHDLIPGAVNVWDTVEFFYWVRKLGYKGWFCIDIYPYRDTGAEVLRRTVQVCRKCIHMADRLMEMHVEELTRDGQHMEVLRLLWDMVGE
jgi:xylose isomerase